MTKIDHFRAYEILDSRGRPTVLAKCFFENGIIGKASVPSGASTGKAEAHELRDGDPSRYSGLGCLKAVHNINKDINDEISGKSYASQSELDEALIHLDDTPDKSRLGANALLACSLAFAKAAAVAQQLPLHHYFGSLAGTEEYSLPRLTVNLFSGGKHAGGQVAVQDLLIVPISTSNIDQSLTTIHQIYYTAASLIRKKYGMRMLTADEGGLAPDFKSVEEMFDLALESIEVSGLNAGKDVSLAMDVASSHFYEDDHYLIDEKKLGGEAMIRLLEGWVKEYPIVSVEDGLAEDDWDHWPRLKGAIGKKTLVLGDDLLCTNVNRIKKAIELKAANALLLKVNQCGTISEAMAAFKLAKSAGWQVTVSARSGETEDDWLADLAVGWGGDQIKVGSITQSERLAKYNRLLEISADHPEFKMKPWKF